MINIKITKRDALQHSQQENIMNIVSNCKTANRIPRHVYQYLNLEYKTKTGNYPIKDAFREALKKFSEYYGKSMAGYHIHHNNIPFDAILNAWWRLHFSKHNVAPVYYCVSAKRFFLPDCEAEAFAEFHDDMLDFNMSPPIYVPKTDHMKIHSYWKQNNKEKESIDEWTSVLIHEYITTDDM